MPMIVVRRPPVPDGARVVAELEEVVDLIGNWLHLPAFPDAG
ncbi:hypothetical protein QBB34_29245 [Streptomyces stelliscabiei]